MKFFSKTPCIQFSKGLYIISTKLSHIVRERMDNVKKDDYIKLILKFIRPPKVKASIRYGQGQFLILHLLNSASRPLSPGELSQLIGVGSGRIGNVLKELEKRELIVRKSHEEDKRVILVQLTEKGKAFIEDKEAKTCQFIDEIYSRAGKEDFMAFLRVVNLINNMRDEFDAKLLEKEDKGV